MPKPAQIEPARDVVVNMARDPFDVVIRYFLVLHLSFPQILYLRLISHPALSFLSGYYYHKRGSEAQVVLEEGKVHARNGNYWVLKKATEKGLPAPSRKETYAHYLSRLSIEDGIFAEMIRTSYLDLPHITAAHETTTTHPKKMRTFCLER
jgi:hypothetical protein